MRVGRKGRWEGISEGIAHGILEEEDDDAVVVVSDAIGETSPLM